MFHRALVATAAVAVLSACASPPEPPPAPPPVEASTVQIFPGIYRPVTLGLAGTPEMGVDLAGAAMRPVAVVHVLWNGAAATAAAPDAEPEAEVEAEAVAKAEAKNEAGKHAGCMRPAACQKRSHPDGCPHAKVTADKMKDALKAAAKAIGGALVEDATVVGGEMVLSFPEKVTFEFDRAALKPEFFPTLNALAESLKAQPRSTVRVVGHTDNVGTEAYNQDLSERRAATVKAYLEARDVAAGRLRAEGRGAAEPVADNSDSEGRAANRRVEITVTPEA